MSTPYSAENQSFSDAAHLCAQRTVYPVIFKCDISNMVFESANVSDGGRLAILDGEMAIDKIVHVQVKTLRAPIVFTIQERYRRLVNRRFTDLTITEFNNVTKQPSELYKMTAGIFLYGFYDDNKNKFERWVAADVNKMLHGIVTGQLAYKKGNNPRSNQDFLGIEVADLFKNECIIAGINKDLWGIK